MIEIGDNKWMIESEDELLGLYLSGKRLYCDGETTSFDPKREAFYAYEGHRLSGFAITCDDDEISYYIPMRHHTGFGKGMSKYNLDPIVCLKWLQETMDRFEDWINHNLKFDAHFLAVEGVFFKGRMIDTATLAKCLNSDRFNHKLKSLCEDWLGRPMREQHTIKAFLKAAKTKDYGELPADMCGDYACEDVVANRALYHYLEENKPPQIDRIWQNEIKLTPVLFHMEHEGMRVDPLEVKKESVKSLTKIIELSTEIAAIAGSEYQNNTEFMYDTLITNFGLPVLQYTEKKVMVNGKRKKVKGGPSFDKDAMDLYAIHPLVLSDPDLPKLVESIRSMRVEESFLSATLNAMAHQIDHASEDPEYIHWDFNQVIRTGRMSARGYNMMAQQKRAKRLFHPAEGEAFLSYDASQVEFRLIAYYLEDDGVLAAYEKDPRTDFHQWVADMCHVARSAGKTINFAIAYGAGEAKITAELAANPDIIKEVGLIVAEMLEKGDIREKDVQKTYKQLCTLRAKEVYHTYHQSLPALKPTMKDAAYNAKARGYCFNAFGRRRHLPWWMTWVAFNTVIQGSAMDYIKEKMILTSHLYNPWYAERNIRLRVNVHDELLYSGPIHVMRDPEVQLKIQADLEIDPILKRPMTVPLKWDGGISDQTWFEACLDGKDIVERDGELWGSLATVLL